MVNPLSWWLEGVRGALFHGSTSSVGGAGSFYAQLTGQPAPEPLTVVVALLVTGTVATLGATVVFRFSEHRARDRGLIDQTTGS